MAEERPTPESLKGHFIISESGMSDPNFFQTVVLMIEHNDEGAFGLVVNRRSRLTLGDIIPKFREAAARDVPVYVGGPVQQEYLFVLHGTDSRHEPSASAAVPVPGVCFEPFFKQVDSHFEDENWTAVPPDDRIPIHLFLGYSGWGPGQLEREMALGSWITHRASADIVFHPNPEQGWKDALRAKGGIYRVFADSNQQPGLN